MALLQWFKVGADEKWLNDSHNSNILKYIPLSRVSKCSSSNVITNEAYLLFFELSSWPKRWSFERLVAAVILRAFVINRILEIFSTCRILWYLPERYPQHFKFRESDKPLLQQSSKMQQHSDPKCQDKKWPCSGTYKHPGPKSFRPTKKSFVTNVVRQNCENILIK